MHIHPDQETTEKERQAARELLLGKIVDSSSKEEEWEKEYIDKMVILTWRRQQLNQTVIQERSELKEAFDKDSNPPDASRIEWLVSFIKDSPKVAELRSEYEENVSAVTQTHAAELVDLEKAVNELREEYKGKSRQEREAYEEKSRQEKCREIANECIETTPGREKLSPEERKVFFDRLYAIEDAKSKKERDQANKTLVVRIVDASKQLLFPEAGTPVETKEKIVGDIESAVHAHELLVLKSDVDKKLKDYKKSDTIPVDLQAALRKELTEAIFNNREKLERLRGLEAHRSPQIYQ